MILDVTPTRRIWWPALLLAAAGHSLALGAAPLWKPQDVVLDAADAHPWWEFPVRGIFRHDTTGEEQGVEGFWDGERRWVVRFAPSRAGAWTYRTVSADRGLDGQQGRLEVSAPAAAELTRNPNLRGPVRIGPGGRYFTFGDGTPFFLLADTVWAVNTARCGLGNNEDGPFFRYLADRETKGFTAVLMQYFHGYGDYPESPGHGNEGGPAFPERDVTRLNPDHFRGLDRRMHALWQRGLVAAINTTWWGKTNQCLFKPEDARRISAYCAVRYAAFNALWSLSGEYQYAFRDCGWTPEDFTALGQSVQAHNPWRRPLSIHPSGQTGWTPPHNSQSSRPFHGQRWLDHHWLQTGQSRDRVFNIITRLEENRALEPAMPVFVSEAWYESALDLDSAYHMRWQVWTAFLNGAAGYGYGAYGLWQFYDPADPTGDKGKPAKDVVPWSDAIKLPGSGQLQHARRLLESLEWWKLAPARGRLRLNGAPNPLPTRADLSPPQAAAIRGQAIVAYVPRGNARRDLTLTLDSSAVRTARWFDPRTGRFSGEPIAVPAGDSWLIPARPVPDEDWVLLLSNS